MDGLGGGLLAGLYYYANDLPPIFRNLLPEVSSGNETIRIAISTTLGLLVICSQGLSRVYIAAKKMNDIGPSNELLSTKTFAIIVVMATAIMKTMIGLPMYLNHLIYMIFQFIIFPLVVLANHPGAGEYFLNRHPKMKEMMEIIHRYQNKVGHQQQDETGPQEVQESSEIQDHSMASGNPSAARSRSMSLPNENKSAIPTMMKRRKSISNDFFDICGNTDNHLKIVDETNTKPKSTCYKPGKASASYACAMPEIDV